MGTATRRPAMSRHSGELPDLRAAVPRRPRPCDRDRHLFTLCAEAAEGNELVAGGEGGEDDDLVPIPMSAEAIAADLTERIRLGEYAPGSQLPPYRVIGELYNVGQTTVAKVMTILRARGVVIGVPGRGTFVPE